MRQRERHTERDFDSVCKSFEPLPTLKYKRGHQFLLPCLENQHKHTMDPHDYQVFLSLWLSLVQFLSHWMEVVMIGPESQVSRTLRRSCLCLKIVFLSVFFFFVLFFFWVSHVIPTSEYRICRLFSMVYLSFFGDIFSGFVRLKRRGSKFVLEIQSLIFVESVILICFV